MPDKPQKGLTAVYVLTRRGLALARRLETALDAQVYVSGSLSDAAIAHPLEEPGKPDGSGIPDPSGLFAMDTLSPDPAGPARRPLRRFSRLADLLRECFHEYARHIFITATGIAVRSIAPLLRGKALDPAVLVIDQRGRFVISLLSGHLGGGNAMAARVADILGAVPVITTATDVEELPALDALAQDKGLAIANLGAIKTVSAALLDGRTVVLHDPDDCLEMAEGPWEALFRREPDARRALEPDSHTDGGAVRAAPPRVIVTERAVFQPATLPEAGADVPPGWLILHPRRLFVGIGCRKNAPERDILLHIKTVLASAGLALEAVAGLASVEAKRDEAGLLRAAETLGLPLRFFSLAELAAHPVSAPSAKAMERFGIPGVCEPAALASAGKGARLVIPKTVDRNVTLAVARAESGHGSSTDRRNHERP